MFLNCLYYSIDFHLKITFFQGNAATCNTPHSFQLQYLRPWSFPLGKQAQKLDLFKEKKKLDLKWQLSKLQKCSNLQLFLIFAFRNEFNSLIIRDCQANLKVFSNQLHKFNWLAQRQHRYDMTILQITQEVLFAPFSVLFPKVV